MGGCPPGCPARDVDGTTAAGDAVAVGAVDVAARGTDDETSTRTEVVELRVGRGSQL